MNNRELGSLEQIQSLLQKMQALKIFSSVEMQPFMKNIEQYCQSLNETTANAEAKELLQNIAATVSSMQKQLGKNGATSVNRGALNEFNMQVILYKQKLERPVVELKSNASSSKSMYQRLQNNDEGTTAVVRRARADGAPPPPVVRPAASPKSNPIPVASNAKRNRELPPLPTAASKSSPTGSPEHKVIRRDSVKLAFELSDLANQLDVAAKSVTSQFDDPKRKSMAAILRKGDHIKDADVMLFVKYFQEEKNSHVKSMIVNSLPPEMAALLAKKPNDLIGSDRELFKAVMSVNPQNAPKLDGHK